MKKQSLLKFEKEVEKRYQQRDRRKKIKMKVNSAGLKRLQMIVSKKADLK